IIGASKNTVAMVEADMKVISEQEMVEPIKFAHQDIIAQIETQERLRAILSLTYREYEPEKNDDDIRANAHAATDDKGFAIAMVEGEMQEISEKEMVEAIKFAHQAIISQIEAQERLRAKLNLTYTEYEPEKNDEAIRAKVHAATYYKAFAIALEASAKHERSE